MKRSLARRLPVLKKFVRELDALEKKYAKLKKQRDNLKLDLAETKTHLEAFQQAEAEVFARRHLHECPLPVPPESLRLRVHGAREEATFLFVGDAIASRIKEILVEEGRSFEAPARILDFGCGCGRTLRFFGDRIENRELFATDIDEEAIAWCKNNLSSLASFACNGHEPPLEYESEAFDLIIAISVFTHLPERLEQAWLAELRRVAKPGALLVLSIHGEKLFRNVPSESQEELRRHGFCFANCGLTAGLPDFYQTSFHSEAYVQQYWSRLFQIRRIADLGLQDVVVCEKRS
ncbi:MAG: methyltransferase domain-containing protein [Chthoniobacterales bacterium]